MTVAGSLRVRAHSQDNETTTYLNWEFEKMYNCEKCNFRAGEKVVLRHHKKVVHNMQTSILPTVN